MNNADLFELIQLAEAAYADFTVSMNKQQAALQAKALAKLQASTLLSAWSVASHQQNTESGFSATLFQSKGNASNYVFAISGTEPNGTLPRRNLNV